jgi:3-oxoacyl-[acyl-carrier protein] reductase
MRDTVVVVTGGGRGIGRAICERFAANGALVVAVARSVDDLNETRNTIEQRGERCEVIPTDVCAPDEVDALYDQVLSRFGRIDILVNNAGVAPLANIEALDPSQFEAIYAVNIQAVYLACRAVWPAMRSQGGGVIINISSVASVDAFSGFAAYGASKAWVNAWTKALAEEGRPLNIRVNAVAPGAVDTRMLRSAFPDFPPDQMLQPADVAEVVFTIAQPSCRYVSGETVFVKK